MGRIFTLQFHYQNNIQDALVSVIMKGQERCFHIQLHNVALDKILLTTHLRYAGTEGFKNLEAYRNDSGKELLDALGSAVKKHLSKKTPIKANQ